MPISAELSRLGGTGAACILVSTPTQLQEAQMLWQSNSLALPESLPWHAETGLFTLSGMGAAPMARDGDGTITTFNTTGPPHLRDGFETDRRGDMILTDNGAGTLPDQRHLMPGGRPAIIATLASGAADLDYGTKAGVIVVPITTEGRKLALNWSPM